MLDADPPLVATGASPSERIAKKRRRRRFLRRYFRSVPGTIGAIVLALFALSAVIHPLLLSSGLWPRSVYHHEYGNDTILTDKTVVLEVTDSDREIGVFDAMLLDPFGKPGDVVAVASLPGLSLRHPFGTDPLGRDVLSMAMAGTGPAFGLGVSAALAIGITSITIATIGAYRRGIADWVLTHVSDTFLLLPAPLLMIILGTSTIGDRIGSVQFGIIYGVLFGASAAAIVLRSQALSVMQQPFIDAARSAGAGSRRIITHHLIPHLVPVATVYMFIGVVGAVIADAFVSWLAFVETRYTWGTMLYFAISYPKLLGGATGWPVLIVGGIAVSLFAASFYLIALGIRSATAIET